MKWPSKAIPPGVETSGLTPWTASLTYQEAFCFVTMLCPLLVLKVRTGLTVIEPLRKDTFERKTPVENIEHSRLNWTNRKSTAGGFRPALVLPRKNELNRSGLVEITFDTINLKECPEASCGSITLSMLQDATLGSKALNISKASLERCSTLRISEDFMESIRLCKTRRKIKQNGSHYQCENTWQDSPCLFKRLGSAFSSNK